MFGIPTCAVGVVAILGVEERLDFAERVLAKRPKVEMLIPPR